MLEILVAGALQLPRLSSFGTMPVLFCFGFWALFGFPVLPILIYAPARLGVIFLLGGLPALAMLVDLPLTAAAQQACLKIMATAMSGALTIAPLVLALHRYFPPDGRRRQRHDDVAGEYCVWMAEHAVSPGDENRQKPAALEKRDSCAAGTHDGLQP